MSQLTLFEGSGEREKEIFLNKNNLVCQQIRRCIDVRSVDEKEIVWNHVFILSKDIYIKKLFLRG